MTARPFPLDVCPTCGALAVTVPRRGGLLAAALHDHGCPRAAAAEEDYQTFWYAAHSRRGSRAEGERLRPLFVCPGCRAEGVVHTMPESGRVRVAVLHELSCPNVPGVDRASIPSQEERHS